MNLASDLIIPIRHFKKATKNQCKSHAKLRGIDGPSDAKSEACGEKNFAGGAEEIRLLGDDGIVAALFSLITVRILTMAPASTPEKVCDSGRSCLGYKPS